jgi:hypothetical protein
MRSATEATTTLMNGLIKIAEIAVPHGCEHVPAVGTGMGIQEITKTTAVINPRRGLNDKSSLAASLSFRKPRKMKGIATTYQNAAQLNGKIPSEICIAYAGDVKTNNSSENPTIFLISSPLK